MAETVNLKKSYSKLNSSLTKLFDESGVRRSFTVPYIEGQPMADHINTLNQAAQQVGGLTMNTITSSHHEGGKGYGSGDGHSVGHPADQLRTTIIPKGDEHAKAVIDAAQKHINNLKFLLGDKDPDVQAAQSSLDLVKPTEAAGMNLFDLASLAIGIMHKPTQAVARAHSGTKAGGHHAALRAPEAPGGQQAAPEAAGASQDQSQAPTDQNAAPEAQGPPAAPAVAPPQAAAPAQAQG
jgi:hypothetical protein